MGEGNENKVGNERDDKGLSQKGGWEIHLQNSTIFLHLLSLQTQCTYRWQNTVHVTNNGTFYTGFPCAFLCFREYTSNFDISSMFTKCHNMPYAHPPQNFIGGSNWAQKLTIILHKQCHCHSYTVISYVSPLAVNHSYSNANSHTTRCAIKENCALLGYYAASSGNFTSSLRYNPEEHSFLHGRSLT